MRIVARSSVLFPALGLVFAAATAWATSGDYTAPCEETEICHVSRHGAEPRRLCVEAREARQRVLFYGDYLVGEEVCDGRDNDCDGWVDENIGGYWGGADDCGEHSEVVITEARVIFEDPSWGDRGTITLYGLHFDAGKVVLVALGSLGELEVLSAGPTEIVALCPGGVCPEGDFRVFLSIATYHATLYDAYDLTIAMPAAPQQLRLARTVEEGSESCTATCTAPSLPFPSCECSCRPDFPDIECECSCSSTAKTGCSEPGCRVEFAVPCPDESVLLSCSQDGVADSQSEQCRVDKMGDSATCTAEATAMCTCSCEAVLESCTCGCVPEGEVEGCTGTSATTGRTEASCLSLESTS